MTVNISLQNFLKVTGSSFIRSFYSNRIKVETGGIENSTQCQVKLQASESGSYNENLTTASCKFLLSKCYQPYILHRVFITQPVTDVLMENEGLLMWL